MDSNQKLKQKPSFTPSLMNAGLRGTFVTSCDPVESSAICFVIGGIWLASILIAITQPQLFSVAVYLSSLAFFHFTEFLVQLKFHPKSTNIEAFLLNHSPEYVQSILAAVIEFFLESLIFKSWKSIFIFKIIGSLLIILGQLIRIVAMYTAKENFSHKVREDLSSNHNLVTQGIYRYLRHPAYTGYFIYGMGSQLLLGNPLCLIVYFIVLRKFFSSRIEVEEEILCKHYGNEYKQYKAFTPSGLPFIQ